MVEIPETTPVTEWYKSKTVFITGASGFMGKVLVEKLLYACPKIKRLYLLIRVKKGKTPQQRIVDMWKSPVSIYTIHQQNRRLVEYVIHL